MTTFCSCLTSSVKLEAFLFVFFQETLNQFVSLHRLWFSVFLFNLVKVIRHVFNSISKQTENEAVLKTSKTKATKYGGRGERVGMLSIRNKGANG